VRQQKALLARPDYIGELGRIDVPTLVLVGAQDVITPPGDARSLAEHVPGATLEVVEECGHLSSLERPAEVAAALRRLLQR
jgi:pimeloyl-ACP methyl ester carboxylesterase